MFTKKHFEVIAAVLAGLRGLPVAGDETTVHNTLDMTAEALADVFIGLNGRFDRDRFLRACGLEEIVA